MAKKKTGVWFLGAYGSIATTAIVGANAIKRGLCDSTGMVSALPEFAGLPMPSVGDFVFGGYDIRKTDLTTSAYEISKLSGSISHETIETVRPDLKKADIDIKTGIMINSGDTIEKFADEKDKIIPLKSIITNVQKDLVAFKKKHGLETVVVINVASTEPFFEMPRSYRSLKAFEKAIAEDCRQDMVASVVYAYAALDAGFPHINFTPSYGSGIPALHELAKKKGLPHFGKDGKTGETLIKTVLAPMFVARNFKLLSWAGFNILGNRDGAVLNDPVNKLAKTKDKDATLRKIVNREDFHSHVSIEYVPSLDDWKTAWDFIHFSGFMDTKMSMQFTWQGCDSMLAAPLVLDLVRFAVLSYRKKEKGLMKHLACFFKNPDSVEDQDFFRQFAMLVDYARKLTKRR